MKNIYFFTANKKLHCNLYKARLGGLVNANFKVKPAFSGSNFEIDLKL